MKNILKKVMASVMAVTSLAIGMTGISASAANSDNFNSWYIAGGAPGSASNTDVAVVSASSDTYTAYCATLTVYNTTGKLTVSCSNYHMSKTVEFTQGGKSTTFTITGDLSAGDANFPCSCYGNGNVYATGTISH